MTFGCKLTVMTRLQEVPEPAVPSSLSFSFSIIISLFCECPIHITDHTAIDQLEVKSKVIISGVFLVVILINQRGESKLTDFCRPLLVTSGNSYSISLKGYLLLQRKCLVKAITCKTQSCIQFLVLILAVWCHFVPWGSKKLTHCSIPVIFCKKSCLPFFKPFSNFHSSIEAV